MALVVGRLVDELRKLSMHDGLTGLLNRRAMEETLQAQVRSSRRSGESFVVMMLDLDYFKRINDQFGHAVGDIASLQHLRTRPQSPFKQVLHSAVRIGCCSRFGRRRKFDSSSPRGDRFAQDFQNHYRLLPT